MTSKNGKKAAFELGEHDWKERLGSGYTTLRTGAWQGRGKEGRQEAQAGKGCVKKAQHKHSIATAQYNIVSWVSSYMKIIVVSDARQLEINCFLICSRILLVHEIVK